MIGEAVTRIRAGVSVSVDRYGNPVPGALVETSIPGVAFDPGGSLEPVEVGRAPVVTTPKLYLRSAAAVVSTDLLRVRGLVYKVEGHPALWVSPFTGVTAGLVVELKLAEG